MKHSIIIFSASLLISFSALAQGTDGVLIDPNNATTRDASAVFQAQSNTQGVLVPRMIAAQRILIPVSAARDGLMVYQTDAPAGFYYYNGATLAWVLIANTTSNLAGVTAGTGLTGGGTSGTITVNAVGDNGLTTNADDIDLGGNLTQAATTITQDGSETFAISNTGTGNTTINLTSTGDFDVQDNGTSALFVRDDGYVGVGTNAPSQKLHINGGDIQLNDAAAVAGYRLKSYSTGTSFWLLSGNTTDSKLVLSTSAHDWDRQVSLSYTPGTTGSAAGNLIIGQIDKNNVNWTHGITQFYTNGVERMRIASDGSVGIGTTGPQSKLHVEAGKIYSSKTTFPNPAAYTNADLVLGSNTDTRGGYTGTNGSHIFLRSSDKSSITALDESNNLGQISYQNLVWTIGEDVGWLTQSVKLPNLAGTGTRFVVADASGTLSASNGTSAGVVTGAGTLNTIPKWTPNGSTLGNSLITDDATTITAGGQFDVTGGTGTSYTTAPIEIRTSAIAPRLAFHYSGVVASQIAIENSGRIAIRDNPGTGYENFIAKDLTTSATLVIGTTVPTINGYSPANGVIRLTPNLHLNATAGNAVIINWDNGSSGTQQMLRIGNGAGADMFGVLANGDVTIQNKVALRGNDSWLRLNQDAGFTSGTYTPGFFRADGGIASGGVGSLGAGTIHANSYTRTTYISDYDDPTYYLDPNSTADAALKVRGGALYGPNTSWSKYLLVGGNGRGGYVDDANVASVSTTDGNLHVDASSAHGLYLNFYDGNVINFGNGANGIIGTVSTSGVLSMNTGFQISGGATSGNYLRGNGTNFVSSAIQPGDLSLGISGTTNTIPKFTGANSIGNSQTTDDGTSVTTSGQFDVTGGTGTGYNTAPVEIRTTLTPRLAFHWPGVVASQIGMDAGGVIRTYNNPGTAYEQFAASNITANGNLIATGLMGASGTAYWGSAGTRTETRDDAGSQGGRSGYYETSAPAPAANWYTGASSWQHLIETRHSNTGNNYAMQFAGSFFDQKLYFRKTNNSATTAWSEVALGGANGPNSTWSLSGTLVSSRDDLGTTNFDADNDDDVSYTRNLGFSVTIDGTSYSQVSVSTNGLIVFGGTGAAACCSQTWPLTISSAPMVAFYYHDMKDYGGGEFMRDYTVGAAPGRTWILRYVMREFSGTVSTLECMVMIHETSGLINVKYFGTNATLNGQANVSNTVIGFQGAGGASAKYYPITFNGKIMDDNAQTDSWSISPVR